MTNGNRNNRKTPAKFRIKRLITNQSRPEGSESTELFEKEKSIKKSQNTQNTTNASSNIK